MTGKGKFSGAFGAFARAKEGAAEAAPEIPNSRTPEIAPAPEPAQVEEKREKYTTFQMPSLIQQAKLYAVKNKLKDYEVVETALREYLEKNDL